MRPKRILVIDDEVVTLKAMRRYLEMKGYEVLTARSGQEGIEQFWEHYPDMVICDIVMPGKTGYDVCRSIKSKQEGIDTPFLIMTSIVKSVRLEIEIKEKWGADDYIQKPFHLKDLEKKIYRWIGPPVGEKGKAPADPAAASSASPQGKRGVPGVSPPRRRRDDASSSVSASRRRPARVTGSVERRPPPPPSRPSLSVTPEPISDLVAVTGTLHEIPFPKLLHYLHRQRFTGSLQIERDRRKKHLHFKEGRVLDIRSNFVRESTLGQLLVSRGKLTERDLRKSRELMMKTGMKQGEALISLGLLTQAEFRHVLEEQSLLHMMELFKWPVGDFVLRGGDIAGEKDAPLSHWEPGALIWRGVEQGFHLERLDRLLDPHRHEPLSRNRECAYTFEKIGLPEGGTMILKEADGTKTIEQLLRSSRLSFGTTYQLIAFYLLVEALLLPSGPLFHLPKYAALPFALGEGTAGAHRPVPKVSPAPSPPRNPLLRASSPVSPPRRTDAKDAPPVVDPERLIKAGEAALARKEFSRAIEALEGARHALPEDPRVLIPLAWALFLAGKEDPAPKTLLKTALEKQHDRLLAARGYYYLGKILEEEGNIRMAQTSFVKAVEFDPSFLEAIEALKHLAPG